MSKRIGERNRVALMERYERDAVATMDKAQWEAWIDNLPVGEFMELIDLNNGSMQ